MRPMLAIGVIVVLGMVAMGGPAQASHQSYTIRYVIGTSASGGAATICVADVGETTYAVGGACTHPCPHGTCDITVVDDHRGTNVWFQILVNDEPFFRPNVYAHTVSVPGEKVRVAVVITHGTTGLITIS